MDVDVLVIGAGPTGIGAAVRLNDLRIDHLVVEAGDEPGGMARSIRDAHGFTWDLGGHVIHSHFADFDKAIAASGVPMREVRRNGYVWMAGELIPTPLQQHLRELPDDLRPGAAAADLGAYYRNNFGSALTAAFFEPYTEKMWAHPLNRIGHEWTSLRSGSGRSNVPPLGLASERPATVPQEHFPYPEGGTGALWTGILHAATQVDRVRFGVSVTDLDLSTRTATLSDGTHVRFTACVNTAPVTAALGWLDRPADAAALVSSTVYAIGFGFTGSPPPGLADKTYLHCPDADVPWYRATMLSNYDPGLAGAGRWNVLCEVSTSAYRPATLAAATELSRRSLERLGADTSRIVSVWSTLVPLGYPVPTLGRDRVLHAVDDTLRASGVYTRGRFGGWRYESCNQDYSFAQGVEAAQHIADGTPEQVYWHPERF